MVGADRVSISVPLGRFLFFRFSDATPSGGYDSRSSNRWRRTRRVDVNGLATG